MKYVQFLAYSLDNEPIDLLGSDGILPLDGRWSLDTCKYEARYRMHYLGKNVRLAGFKIMSGERISNNNVCLHQELN